MQIWKLLQRLFVFWSNTQRRGERRHRAGGLSICSEVFWKLPKNNKLSVLEVVKLGKSYSWLVHISYVNVCDIHFITCIAHLIYAPILYNSVSQSNGLKNYFSLQIAKTEIPAFFIEYFQFQSKSLNFSFLSKLNYFHYTFTSLHQMVLWICFNILF